ncbi:hypothetical protein E2C01_051187 [Portunus trituberculatus]|uniref:Uncharacterized protein n=1 Tax=Portunus trituberculatus TaxID=210409 RepID=A0A5B7GAW6_PORTR|nr:hypothetical protein [Portunus trituberculatus]
MFELFDCAALIAQVEKRPRLDDFQLKEHTDKNTEEKLWPEVCEAGVIFGLEKEMRKSTPAILTSVFIGVGIIFCGCAMIHNVFIWQKTEIEYG